jgi:hypothetical protein
MWFRRQKNYGKFNFPDVEFLEAKKVRTQALLIATAGVIAVIVIDIIMTIIILRLESGRS